MYCAQGCRRLGNSARELLRRLQHTEAGNELAAPHNVKKEYDANRYGGWKSAKMLFTEVPEQSRIVGRWDWHVVQFMLALVPPGMVLLLVAWARSDMSRMLKKLHPEVAEQLEAMMRQQGGQQQQAEAARAVAAQAGAAGPAAAAPGGGSGSGEGAPVPQAPAPAARQQDAGGSLQARLSQLEALVAALVAEQAARAAQAAEVVAGLDAAAEASASSTGGEERVAAAGAGEAGAAAAPPAAVMPGAAAAANAAPQAAESPAAAIPASTSSLEGPEQEHEWRGPVAAVHRGLAAAPRQMWRALQAVGWWLKPGGGSREQHQEQQQRERKLQSSDTGS